MQICARQHWWSRSERVDAHPSCVLVSRQETRIYQSVKRLVVSELRGGKENRWRKWKIERIRSKERGRKTPLFCAWTLFELRLKRDSVSVVINYRNVERWTIHFDKGESFHAPLLSPLLVAGESRPSCLEDRDT